MRRKWTRRTFLETSLAGTLVWRGASAVKLAASPAARAEGPLTPAERKALRAVMDEIIPAADGMPAASEVGGEEYLSRLAGRNAGVREDLKQSLDRLNRMSKTGFGEGLARISRLQRVAVLQDFEHQDANLFAALRDHVYEAYYTQPRVWKLIGYEFYPTNASGPQMKPFDDSALAAVRKKPRHYREVS